MLRSVFTWISYASNDVVVAFRGCNGIGAAEDNAGFPEFKKHAFGSEGAMVSEQQRTMLATLLQIQCYFAPDDTLRN